MRIERFKKRIAMTIGGVSVSGVAVGMMTVANFGIDPFQTFAHGVHHFVPLSFGTFYMIINAVLLLLDYFLDKHYIGLATFFNLFLLGYIVDGSTYVTRMLFPNPNIWVRIALEVVAFIILCFGTSLYFTSNLGVSTFDALIRVVADRTILSLRVSFIVLDCICVAIGWACGCIPGVATVVTALCMGPLVHFFNEKFSFKFLWGRNAEFRMVKSEEAEA